MLILVLIFFLLLSAFFSGSEIAFISANKLGVEVERGKGKRKGRIMASFFDSPKDFLSAMLVGNNIALVAFTMLMTDLLQPYLEMWLSGEGWILFIITMITTVVVLIFGEFLPKNIFRLFANDLMITLTYPLAFFKWLLVIPSKIMMKLSNLVIKYIFRVSTDDVEDAITRLDLQDFVEGTISEDHEEIEADMFRNALHLKKVKVKECMVPRTEIAAMDVSGDIEELKAVFKESGHSRILVYDGDIDKVLGYIHHLQLLKNPKELRRHVRELDYLPEVMNVFDLMLSFMKEGTNIACVVDEFGGTAGLITLEDILEEIFGEIDDEYDDDQYLDVRISEDEYIFSGRLEIDYVNEKYDKIKFPTGDYETLSGYLVMTLGEIPDSGKKIDLDGYRFIFEQVSDKKVETVRVKILEGAL